MKTPISTQELEPFVSVSLFSKWECKNKQNKNLELKKTPETVCELQTGTACTEYKNWEPGIVYQNKAGMLKLGVPGSKWKTLQKVVENLQAG